jgi:hypothetical protein
LLHGIPIGSFSHWEDSMFKEAWEAIKSKVEEVVIGLIVNLLSGTMLGSGIGLLTFLFSENLTASILVGIFFFLFFVLHFAYMKFDAVYSRHKKAKNIETKKEKREKLIRKKKKTLVDVWNGCKADMPTDETDQDWKSWMASTEGSVRGCADLSVPLTISTLRKFKILDSRMKKLNLSEKRRFATNFIQGVVLEIEQSTINKFEYV